MCLNDSSCLDNFLSSFSLTLFKWTNFFGYFKNFFFSFIIEHVMIIQKAHKHQGKERREDVIALNKFTHAVTHSWDQIVRRNFTLTLLANDSDNANSIDGKHALFISIFIFNELHFFLMWFYVVNFYNYFLDWISENGKAVIVEMNGWIHAFG